MFISIALGLLSENDVRAYVKEALKTIKITPSEGIEDLIIRLSGGHISLVNYFTSKCGEMLREGNLNVSALQRSFRDPNGLVVTLIRQIRLQLFLYERELVDSAYNDHSRLSDSEKQRLIKLRNYGLLQPGIPLT